MNLNTFLYDLDQAKRRYIRETAEHQHNLMMMTRPLLEAALHEIERQFIQSFYQVQTQTQFKTLVLHHLHYHTEIKEFYDYELALNSPNWRLYKDAWDRAIYPDCGRGPISAYVYAGLPGKTMNAFQPLMIDAKPRPADINFR